jgi:hypothetical protein
VRLIDDVNIITTAAGVALTQRRRRKFGEKNAVARAIAFKDLALHEWFARVGPELFPNLLLRLPESERLGLGEEVGKEDAVML